MVIRVFVDTNILLSFYELSREDTEQLAHLFILDGQAELKLVVTDHLEREFWRRRASVIAATLKTIGELRLPVVPEMGKALAESGEFNKLKKLLSSAHKDFISALNKTIQEKTLFADVLVKGIFASAERLSVSAETLNEARNRVDCGNPPGKKGELGDAINWQLLLSLPVNTSRLVIVTQDRDFVDPLNQGNINSFLEMEWNENQKGKLLYFSGLNAFLTAFFPTLEFSSLAQAVTKISELAGSGSFAHTHEVIAELAAINFFTVKQVNYLVQVLSQNNQVNWIISDPDVKSFYTSILKNFLDKLAFAEFRYLSDMLEYDGSGLRPTLEISI